MKQKPLLIKTLIATTASLLLTSTGYALVNLKDTATLYFNGGITERYESNIFQQSNNTKDDFITIPYIGLEAVSGKSSPVKMKAMAREDFYFYYQRPKLNVQEADLSFDAKYEGNRLKVAASYEFYQTHQNTPDISFAGRLMNRAINTANLTTDYRISEKTAVGAGFEFTDTYQRTKGLGLKNSQVYTIPATFWYKYSPKLEFGPSYRYRYTNIHQDRKTDDHFANFAIRGELASKLTAEINLGVQYREFSGSRRATPDAPRFSRSKPQFAMLSKFTYEVTNRITAFAGVSRDYAFGATGLVMENLSGNIGGNYKFNDKVTANAGLSYTNSKFQYSSRKDDIYGGNLGVKYQCNKNILLGADYTYSRNKSNTAGSSYTDHIVNVTAGMRY